MTTSALVPCCSPEDLRYPAEKYGRVKDVYLPKARADILRALHTIRNGLVVVAHLYGGVT